MEAAELYVGTLATAADMHPDPATGPALTRDPDDDYVIHLARAHDANFVVSGDADLPRVGRAGSPGDPTGGVRGEAEPILRVRRQHLGRDWAA